MYLPLKFMEQMEHYYTISNRPFMGSFISSKSINLFETLGVDKCLDLYLGVGNISQANKKHHKALSLEAMSNDEFMHTCLYSTVYAQWSKNKVVYSLNNELCSKFIDMQLPAVIPESVLTKLPFGCFYVDLCGMCPFMEDVHGLFVTTSLSCDKTAYNIAFFTLIDSNKALYVDTKLVIPVSDITDSGMLSLEKINECRNVEIVSEDGKTRTMNERLFFKLVLNFLTYLQACNKDVEISDRTKEIKKKHSVPKNKLSDVTEYSVGFRKASTVTSGKIHKYKYDKKESTEHRSLRGHYRAAHWHTYWKGPKENKERIIKWIDVLYVNGTKCDDVIIHKVK